MTAERSQSRLHTQVCIVGGGPAGMVLGLLLARSGIRTVVLEKHADFFRDFRGDTVHPSTLEILYELGLLEKFLQRPHQKAESLRLHIGDAEIKFGDFRRLPTHCRFLVMMPQWHFLDFLRVEAEAYPEFQLLMSTQATDLFEEHGKVTGVKAQSGAGEIDIRADLVVAADGRHSLTRQRAGLPAQDLGAPIDVLWLRLSRRTNDPDQLLGRIDSGHIFVMIDRDDYWQCGFVIPKGTLDRIHAAGIETFREMIAKIAPFLQDRVQEIASFDDIKLLNVQVNRLKRWAKPGLLCIGDAAHAMSPVGGVGINLAIQDAVAAANLLSELLRQGPVSLDVLNKVQRRREFPTKVVQWAQVTAHQRILLRVLKADRPLKVPFLLRLIDAVPLLRSIPAYVVGVGLRPEHPRPI